MVKLFSNFDTKAPAKHYGEAVQDFWFDKVIFLRRHKLYFILYTFIPISIALLLMWVMIYSMISARWDTIDWSVIFHRGGEFILMLLILYFVLLGRFWYFNYILDYTIITPVYISSYNQKWVFSREIKTLDTEKIKTIDFLSSGFISSIFNFGKIVILLEWDETGKWEIVIDFIYKPEGIKDWIKRITNIQVDSGEVTIDPNNTPS